MPPGSGLDGCPLAPRPFFRMLSDHVVWLPGNPPFPVPEPNPGLGKQRRQELAERPRGRLDLELVTGCQQEEPLESRGSTSSLLQSPPPGPTNHCGPLGPPTVYPAIQPSTHHPSTICFLSISCSSIHPSIHSPSTYHFLSMVHPSIHSPPSIHIHPHKHAQSFLNSSLADLGWGARDSTDTERPEGDLVSCLLTASLWHMRLGQVLSRSSICPY